MIKYCEIRPPHNKEKTSNTFSKCFFCFPHHCPVCGLIRFIELRRFESRILSLAMCGFRAIVFTSANDGDHLRYYPL